MQGSKGIILLAGLALCLGMIAGKGRALSPEVRNLGPVVNSEESDFAPVVSPDGNYLFFTSDRGEGQGGQDIWVSQRENGEWGQPVNLGPPINTNLNQGPDCFLTEGTREFLYLTFCEPSGAGFCNIYVSEKKEDGTWTQPESLPSPINTDYSDANATWDYVNQVMYFSSTRPGGMPGTGPKKIPKECSYDIWRCRFLPNRTWGEPVPLGEPINTPGWEGVAFYHAADQSLYFSSNGHGGQGGADIFRTRETEAGKWAVPEPMDVVNTPGNDMYFSIPAAGDVAYFSSNMTGGYGLEDIYQVPLDLFLAPEVLALRSRYLPTAQRKQVIGAGLIETVYFDFDRSVIRESEVPKLEQVRALLAENPEVKIEVSGHACSVGDLDYNQLLSNARSEAVRKYLLNQGIAPDRMRVAFYGETRPAEPNDPVHGNPLNRRVEISIQ